MKPSIHSGRSNRIIPVKGQPTCAFTLTELLVVLGTLAVLALVLVPALAGTKIDTWRIQCQNNLKQLQVGFQLFAQDHGDMLPPAGWASGGSSNRYQISWDSFINKYIGGNLSDLEIVDGDGAFFKEISPERTRPRQFWHVRQINSPK